MKHAPSDTRRASPCPAFLEALHKLSVQLHHLHHQLRRLLQLPPPELRPVLEAKRFRRRIHTGLGQHDVTLRTKCSIYNYSDTRFINKGDNSDQKTPRLADNGNNVKGSGKKELWRALSRTRSNPLLLLPFPLPPYLLPLSPAPAHRLP